MKTLHNLLGTFLLLSCFVVWLPEFAAAYPYGGESIGLDETDPYDILLSTPDDQLSPEDLFLKSLVSTGSVVEGTTPTVVPPAAPPTSGQKRRIRVESSTEKVIRFQQLREAAKRKRAEKLVRSENAEIRVAEINDLIIQAARERAAIRAEGLKDASEYVLSPQISTALRNHVMNADGIDAKCNSSLDGCSEDEVTTLTKMREFVLRYSQAVQLEDGAVTNPLVILARSRDFDQRVMETLPQKPLKNPVVLMLDNESIPQGLDTASPEIKRPRVPIRKRCEAIKAADESFSAQARTLFAQSVCYRENMIAMQNYESLRAERALKMKGIDPIKCLDESSAVSKSDLCKRRKSALEHRNDHRDGLTSAGRMKDLKLDLKDLMAEHPEFLTQKLDLDALAELLDPLKGTRGGKLGITAKLLMDPETPIPTLDTRREEVKTAFLTIYVDEIVKPENLALLREIQADINNTLALTVQLKCLKAAAEEESDFKLTDYYSVNHSRSDDTCSGDSVPTKSRIIFGGGGMSRGKRLSRNQLANAKEEFLREAIRQYVLDGKDRSEMTVRDLYVETIVSNKVKYMTDWTDPKNRCLENKSDLPRVAVAMLNRANSDSIKAETPFCDPRVAYRGQAGRNTGRFIRKFSGYNLITGASRGE